MVGGQPKESCSVAAKRNQKFFGVLRGNECGKNYKNSGRHLIAVESMQ